MKEFNKLVQQAIKLLRSKALKLLKEVRLEILIRPELERNIPSWGRLGGFEGRRKNGQGFYPPIIRLYKEDILFANRNCNKKVIINHIAQIISHELCHYIGANEWEADLFKKNMQKFTKFKEQNEKDTCNWLCRICRKAFGKKTAR